MADELPTVITDMDAALDQDRAALKQPEPTPTPEPEPEAPEAEAQAEPESEAEPEEDENEKRLARLAYKAREAERQLKATQLEVRRLRGELPPETVNEQVGRLARDEATKQATIMRFNEKCDEVAEQGKVLDKNFEKNLGALWEELGGFHAGIVETAMEVGQPAAVLNYLGKNTDIAAEIANMPPAKQAVALTKIAVKLEQKPAVVVSKAPAPLKSVGSKPTTKAPELDLENGPIDQVMAHWDKVDRERRAKRY